SLAAAASFGRCSLNRSPGTAVAVSLYGPPFLWPGLRSQVSVWLGPPDIHRTMHALVGFFSAAAARRGSHGQAAAPNALATLIRTRSRRLNSRAVMGPSPLGTEDEFGTVEQRPEDVRERLSLGLWVVGLRPDHLEEPLALGRT